MSTTKNDIGFDATILHEFDTISLLETASASLQSRMDYKYVINRSQLPMILNGTQAHYDIMQIDDRLIFQYDTLYYDFPDYQLYLAHHNGKLNRYKVRCRKYVDTDNVFVEVKFKNNKGQTIKNRISSSEMEYELSEESLLFIAENSNVHARALRPALLTKYKRITLVAKNRKERVTIDLNLSFDNFKRKSSMDDAVIIEVKREKEGDYPSIMGKELKQAGVLPSSISKYCMGIVTTTKEVKKNNFKPKLRQLSKKGIL